jgi:hypothetical protein
LTSGARGKIIFFNSDNGTEGREQNLYGIKEISIIFMVLKEDVKWQ